MLSRELAEMSHLVILPSADTETRTSALSSPANLISCFVQMTCHTGCRCFLKYLLERNILVKLTDQGFGNSSF